MVIARIVNVVRSPHIAVIAIALITCGVARAAPVRVPMLIVDAPATFDAARFATSLETYVTNASVVASPRATAADDEVCADALARARTAAVPVALWARWTGNGMAVSMVTVDKGCGAVESSTVDVPPDQPDFVYRVAALKIASLLRALPAERDSIVEPTSVPPGRSGWDAPPLRVRTVHRYGAIEVGATGVASLESARRTHALVASTWVNTRFFPTRRDQPTARFSLGATLLASAAHDANAAGGSGSARMFGALVGGRAIAARSDRFAVVGELDVGALCVWSSAERTTGAEAMSETVWTPIVSLAPHLRVKVAGRIHLIAGPTLDLSRPILLTLGETALYQTTWLRFRWDARLQIWF